MVTALFGVGLVVSQVMIYYSLVTVPAWNSWATWVQFFGTALLLGALAEREYQPKLMKEINEKYSLPRCVAQLAEEYSK